MSEPAAEDLIHFTFSQTDTLPKDFRRNSCQHYGASNLGHNNIDLNKTFDLNKYDEHIKTSGRIKTVLEPLNKYTLDCTNRKKNVPRKLSEIESLESDESLGILPDLLNDEMTLEPFKTELCFSEDEIHDGIDPEINENPTSFVFSPPIDNQFNRISLFLKNISTPLPNFGNERRCSSTPKVLAAGQFGSNTIDIEHYSSPHLPDEKEEPIIAGSCNIKFETDFNLDDLRNVKPLTSTYKTFSPPRLPSIFNELNETKDLKSGVNFRKNPEMIENNLNVTQTFSHNVENLFPCEHEGNIQNVSILNNTFQIKQPVFMESADADVSFKHSIPTTMKTSQEGSNNCSEKEKVVKLDSTFAIPGDEICCIGNFEKTFLIDFNSAVGTEVSSKFKDGMLNETQVLEMDSNEFSSNKREQIANVTFTKDLENDTQTNLEHHCYSSYGAAFKPKKQILEENLSGNEFKPMTPISEETFSENNFKPIKPVLEGTFSENDLNEMKVLRCINSKSQLVSPKTFNIKTNVTFSEKVEIFPVTNTTQNNSYSIEFGSPNSSKAFSDIFREKEEKNCFLDQINLTENENNISFKKPLPVALQPVRDVTFSDEINERTNQEIDEFLKNNSTKNVNSVIEHESPKSLKVLSNTFNDEVEGKIGFRHQIDLTETENNPSNKMMPSVTFQSIRDATFSEVNERADHQEIDKFRKSDLTGNVNIIELASSKSPRVLASTTFNEKVEKKISLHDEIHPTESEIGPVNKMLYLDPERSSEKSDQEIDIIYEKDSIQNESPGELASFMLPKISKSLTFSDVSEATSILESSVFQDSNDHIEQDAPNSQPIFSRETCSLNSSNYDNCCVKTNFSNTIEDSILTGNTSDETRSIPKEDYAFEIFPESLNTCASTTFSEKNDLLQSDMDPISTENDQVQISKKSLKEMTNATFSEKTGEVQIELISISNENDKFQASPNSLKEVTNAPFSKLADKDMKDLSEVQISQCDQDSPGEAVSSNLTKCSVKGTSRNATDKLNSSLKNCSLKSKTVVKSGLIKPTFLYQRKNSEQHNGQLPVKPLGKPNIDKKSITSGLNHTLNLCDNSANKSFSKVFNRKLSLSCSSASGADNSKSKNDFKKPFGIPSKLGIKRPESNVQKSKLDTKDSNGHLKEIHTINDKQNLLTQPDLISGKDPNIVKSVAVASKNVKGSIVSKSARLSLCEKLPLKSLKMKECGLTSSTVLGNTVEKSKNKVISCPKVVDLPKKVIPEIRKNNSNFVKNYSRHSIAALPRKFLPFNNTPNKTCNLKPSVIKQASVPASNSSKPDSLKGPGCIKLPNSIAKLKFSSRPKVQSCIKISSGQSESKSVVNKKLASGNQKSNGFLPCSSEREAMQFEETQMSTDVKLKDNTRENTQPKSSMLPTSREPMQSLNPSIPRRNAGKLPQLRRIPAPRCNK